LTAKCQTLYNIYRAKLEEENIGLYVTSQYTFSENPRTIHAVIDPELAPEQPIVDYTKGYPTFTKTMTRFGIWIYDNVLLPNVIRGYFFGTIER